MIYALKKKRRHKKHVNDSSLFRLQSMTLSFNLCVVFCYVVLTRVVKVKWRTGESRLYVSSNRTTN